MYSLQLLYFYTSGFENHREIFVPSLDKMFRKNNQAAEPL